MLERFRQHLEQTHLIAPNAKILVGYSGGADSTCLLHLLHATGFDVTAGHLHHGQRPEADKEMKLCEAFCEEQDIPFVSGRADVPRMSRDLRIGIEEAGRMARYNFMEQAARRLECDTIVTAHTRTDHIETMLFNLIRGTGLSGLSGIPSRRKNIVRPLLPFSREETIAYCEEHNLWFHNDPGNENIDFSRVRIRQRITSEINLINPNYEVAMARCAGIIEEEDRFLNGAAAAALEQSEVTLNGELSFLTKDVEMAFSRLHLTSLPQVLFKRAARLAFQSLGATLDFDQTELLSQGIQEPRGSITADGGEIVCEWDAEKLHFRVLKPTEPFRFGITCPGETESDEFGWKLTARNKVPSADSQKRNSLLVELPKNQIRGDLYFRSSQPGDAMQPLGFDGTRKLSDLLSESKLTPAAKVRLPLICDFLGPIWAPGVCLSNRMYKSEDCVSVVELKFERIEHYERSS